MIARASTRTHVLVVDDEQDIAGLIKHGLEKGGDIEVEIVGTGDGALKAVNERTPDLIVLDLNLPVLSGLEVCRILRSRPNSLLRACARCSVADARSPATARAEPRHSSTAASTSSRISTRSRSA
jgi:CheY-like chemotaxis protein